MSVTHELVIDDKGNLKRVPIDQGLGAGEIRIDTSQIEQMLSRFGVQLSEAADMNSKLDSVISQLQASTPQLPAGTPIFESLEVLVDVGVIVATRTLRLLAHMDTREWWRWSDIHGANTVGFVLHGPGSFTVELNNHVLMSTRFDVRPGMVPVFEIPGEPWGNPYDYAEFEIRFNSCDCVEDLSVTVVIGKK